MADAYDVVVIGAGPGGYVAAIRAAQLGLKVACVEANSYEGGLGGTCLNWGCIPAKALLESAALAQTLKSHGEEFGVRPVDVDYDMWAAVNRSRGISEKLSEGVAYLFKKNGIDAVFGRGRLTPERRVVVEPVNGDGEARTLEAPSVIIPTGAVMQTFPAGREAGDWQP